MVVNILSLYPPAWGKGLITASLSNQAPAAGLSQPLPPLPFQHLAGICCDLLPLVACVASADAVLSPTDTTSLDALRLRGRCPAVPVPHRCSYSLRVNSTWGLGEDSAVSLRVLRSHAAVGYDRLTHVLYGTKLPRGRKLSWRTLSISYLDPRFC